MYQGIFRLDAMQSLNGGKEALALFATCDAGTRANRANRQVRQLTTVAEIPQRRVLTHTLMAEMFGG